MYIHVYTPLKLHAQSFINLQKLVKPINCQQNFSVLSSPQKPSVWKIGLKKLLYTEHCLFPAYGKILPTISAFSVFLWSPFSGKTHHKTAETSKTSVRMEDFSKIKSNFFAGNSKILPVFRGVGGPQLSGATPLRL